MAKVKGFGSGMIGGNWILSFGASNIGLRSTEDGWGSGEPKLILKLFPRGNSAVAASSCAYYTSGGSLNLMLKVRGNAATYLIVDLLKGRSISYLISALDGTLTATSESNPPSSSQSSKSLSSSSS